MPDALAPVGPVECQLADSIVMGQWRLSLAENLEGEIFARAAENTKDPCFAAGEAWLAHSKEIALITLYEQRIRRGIKQDKADLAAAQSARLAADAAEAAEAAEAAGPVPSQPEAEAPQPAETTAPAPSSGFVCSSAPQAAEGPAELPANLPAEAPPLAGIPLAASISAATL